MTELRHVGCEGEGCVHCANYDADPVKWAKAMAYLKNPGVVTPEAMRQVPLTIVRTDCVHKGEYLGLVNCPTCPNEGRTKAKLFACEIHKRCSPFAYAIPDAASCGTCGDYLSPDAEILNSHHKAVMKNAANAEVEAKRSIYSKDVHYFPDLVPGLPDPMKFDVPLESTGRGLGGVRDAHIRGLYSLIVAGLPDPAKREGEGIVYVGGGRYWKMIVMGVKMARRVTDLPIQIWHNGKEEDVWLPDLQGIPGVTVHDIDSLDPLPRRTGGWENKTTAIINSGFARVLFLDADAYVTSDPSTLLSAARRHGLCFWSDFDNEDTIDWPWYGIAKQKVPVVQGGQLAIDVEEAWDTLVVAHAVNQHSDYFFAHQYGDQDSWRVALSATRAKFLHMGKAGWRNVAFVCDYGASQIVHRCQAKFWPDGEAGYDESLPCEEEVRKIHDGVLLGDGTAKDVFGRIYEKGMWGANASSGGGSSKEEAQPYLDAVHAFGQMAGWKTVVDLGCGDGRVTSRLKFPEVYGVDVFSPHVERLTKEQSGVNWLCLDIDKDREQLPSGDAALVRDVLHHWPSVLILDWVDWAKKSGKWKFVIFCYDCNQARDGDDCQLGGYRPLKIHMRPLRELNLIPVQYYLHKQIVALKCDGV